VQVAPLHKVGVGRPALRLLPAAHDTPPLELCGGLERLRTIDSEYPMIRAVLPGGRPQANACYDAAHSLTSRHWRVYAFGSDGSSGTARCAQRPRLHAATKWPPTAPLPHGIAAAAEQ
jgi:hypothetical protein